MKLRSCLSAITEQTMYSNVVPDSYNNGNTYDHYLYDVDACIDIFETILKNRQLTYTQKQLWKGGKAF